MQLHQRGVDLLVDVMDAADRVDQLKQDEIRDLLKEVAEVMSQILERDAVVALNGRDRHLGEKVWENGGSPPDMTEIPTIGGKPGRAEQP